MERAPCLRPLRGHPPLRGRGGPLWGGRAPGARPRVEHASLVREDLLARMVRLGAVAAVQPQFVVSDFWTTDRVGPERIRWAYPFRTMLAAGVAVAGSTDCPVERLDPWQAIARAVVRDAQTPGERLSPRQAIEIFTRGGAYAAGDEAQLGTLEPGKRADFLVLDQDPFTADPETLATNPVPNPLAPYITNPLSGLSQSQIPQYRDPTSQFHVPFPQFTSFSGDSPPIANSPFQRPWPHSGCM